MIIRSATESDVTGIVKLARELADHVGDPDPGEETAQLLDAAFGDGKFCELIVAEAAGRIIGFAAFSNRYELHTACRSIWLSDLVVTEKYRDRQVGGRLLEGVKKRAIELGARKVVFDVWQQNTGAFRFYRKQLAVQIQDVDIWEIDLSERR